MAPKAGKTKGSASCKSSSKATTAPSSKRSSKMRDNPDVKEWKGLFRKLGKDAQLRKALTDMGILDDEGDADGSPADTLHRILDAIKSGNIVGNTRRLLPDYESCSSSEDEEEEGGRRFGDVGDPPVVTYDYDGASVTKTVGLDQTRLPTLKTLTKFNPDEPLSWSERNGMGRILVTPMAEFFERYFEKKPLHECVRDDSGKGRERFSDLLSEQAIFGLLSEKQLRYGQDVDVTIVGEDGVRQTLNSDGVVDASFVKERFAEDGCSVRLLHPQRFSDPLWSLMYRLECYWGSCVGCNAYLTPKGSRQGFAPHFDDIDAFVVQVSGKKTWRLYKAPDESLVLPRYSSRDFAAGELGKPFWQGTLGAGDVLYLPRGMIHEASSLAESNSLHVTISMNQRNNYFEFLTSLFSNALETSARDSVAFRKTLPRGLLLSDSPEAVQEVVHDAFHEHLDRLMEGVFLRVNAQSTMCRAFSEFMLNRLPPPPDARRFAPLDHATVSAGTSVALTYPQSAYAELDVTGKTPALFVYHCLSNSRDLHQTLDGGEGEGDDADDRVEPQLEVPLECGPALHTLLSGRVLELGEDDMASESMRVIDLAQALVDAGILSIVEEEDDPSFSDKSRKSKKGKIS